MTMKCSWAPKMFFEAGKRYKTVSIFPSKEEGGTYPTVHFDSFTLLLMAAFQALNCKCTSFLPWSFCTDYIWNYDVSICCSLSTYCLIPWRQILLSSTVDSLCLQALLTWTSLLETPPNRDVSVTLSDCGYCSIFWLRLWINIFYLKQWCYNTVSLSGKSSLDTFANF